MARRGGVLENAGDEIAQIAAVRPKTLAINVTTREGRPAPFSPRASIPTFPTTPRACPTGVFKNSKRDDRIEAIDGNALAPIAPIEAPIDGMIARHIPIIERLALPAP